LCDQVTSLEEECDSLAESERRASSYLAEIEMLREQIVSLENKLNASESKSQSMNRSEAELITALRRSEEKCASLLEERAKGKIRATRNNQECEPEKSRQVKYLEQENLQLMMELKSAKKKLQAARSEIDNLRMEVLDEDSEDFDSFETTKIQENKENIQEEIKQPSSTLISNEKLVGSPGKVKSSRQSEREGNRRGIGLGMARDEDDNTSECRQS
jgi:chromosome segregation ATPase